jgi:hypothetical protein
VDKIDTSIICCFNRGTVLTDASRILPETTCQVLLAPHQWRTVDISKIIKNYFNILNLFYATSFAFCHMAANYCTSLSSQFMYTSESSVPADFCYSSQARTHTHTHTHTHTSKCTTNARNVQDVFGSNIEKQMLEIEQHFVPASSKCVKVDILIWFRIRGVTQWNPPTEFRCFNRKARCMWLKNLIYFVTYECFKRTARSSLQLVIQGTRSQVYPLHSP